MKKFLALIAAVVTVMGASQAMAQCGGCSQGVSPTFSRTVYRSAPVFRGRMMTYTRSTSRNSTCNTSCGTVAVAVPTSSCGTTCGSSCGTTCGSSCGTTCRNTCGTTRVRRVYRSRGCCGTTVSNCGCNSCGGAVSSGCNSCGGTVVSGCNNCGGTVVAKPVFDEAKKDAATPQPEAAPPVPTPVPDAK